ncbi:hypothetical protein ACFL96_20605 [Thermoproteota archaeon]
MRIGIDIDGVICDLVKNILIITKEMYGFNLRKEDIYKHEIHEVLGLEKDSFGKVFVRALSSLNHPAVKGAVTYINKLKKKHKIILVTSRPKRFNRITREWLRMNNIDYDKLVNIKSEKHTKLGGFDFFIDDHLGEIVFASRIKGLKSILFDQPWNKSFNMENSFVRVRTWRKIYSLIENK